MSTRARRPRVTALVGAVLALVGAVTLFVGCSGRPLPERSETTVIERDVPRPLPLPLYGVTLEQVPDPEAAATALARHRHTPTARLVFDAAHGPEDYAEIVSALRPKAYLMGELLDSTQLGELTTAQYQARAQAFVERFDTELDIYEVGNEINGEWAGEPAELNAKVLAAYRAVRQHNPQLRTAITLNLWPSADCYAEPWENTLDFADQLPSEVKGVDFVFLSFYETACEPRARPSAAEFATFFERVHKVFPAAQLGFGEVGAQGVADGLAEDPSQAEKKLLIERYYGLQPQLQRLGSWYVGGYFWWGYGSDAVPVDRPQSLWPNIESAFNSY